MKDLTKNVAVTRTKGKLVIINNYRFFKQNLSKADVVLNVLDKSFNSSYFILPQNYLKSFKEIDLSLFNKRLDISLGKEDIKNEISFYPAFKKDLYEAEERVIMISPFITPNRISTLIDYFRHLVDQGIEVIIFTRPTNRQPIEKQEAEKLIKMMKDMNIKIILERDIHQKIIFIDKKICWFGSLNVLSHNRSEELMVRFEGSSTIEKLYEYSRINLYLDREKRNKEKEKYQKLIFNELIKSIQSPYCFRCEKEMTIRFGRYGPFFGCSNFPECEATENIPTEIVRNIIDEMGIPCPDDSCDGYLQYRRAKGVHFLGCSNYPVCKNTVSIF